MQKIILDTNFIVSGLISNSKPTRILFELVLAERVKMCLSEEVFSEYVEVINREKFAQFIDFKSKANVVLNRFREISFFYETCQNIDILQDTSDNKFLELAAASSANFLITGNINDFNIDEFENTRIVTPGNYWGFYKPNTN